MTVIKGNKLKINNVYMFLFNVYYTDLLHYNNKQYTHIHNACTTTHI